MIEFYRRLQNVNDVFEAGLFEPASLALSSLLLDWK